MNPQPRGVPRLEQENPPNEQQADTAEHRDELEQTDIEKRLPGRFQRLGDVVRRVVEKATRDAAGLKE